MATYILSEFAIFLAPQRYLSLSTDNAISLILSCSCSRSDTSTWSSRIGCMNHTKIENLNYIWMSRTRLPSEVATAHWILWKGGWKRGVRANLRVLLVQLLWTVFPHTQQLKQMNQHVNINMRKDSNVPNIWQLMYFFSSI